MRLRMRLIAEIAVSAALVWSAVELWAHRASLVEAWDFAGAAQTPSNGSTSAGVPVVTVQVELRADDLLVETVGTGRAGRSITLRADAEGKIVDMALVAGQRFEAGALLLRLDDRDETLALDLARARLAEAERVFQRLEALESQAITSTARLDEVRTAREIASIEVARAAEALADRSLLAPFPGVAGLPLVEIGDRIDTETEIASFDDRSEILVGFDLPEAYIGRLEQGAQIVARTPAYPDERFVAEIDAVDSRVDPVSRTARVRVAVPNPGERLRPGSSFTVSVALPGETYPMVPELSLQFAREGPYVWVVRGGESHRVPVRLVRRRAGEVLVEGALDKSEAVVVEGVQRLRDGRAVKVLDGDDTVAAAGANTVGTARP